MRKLMFATALVASVAAFAEFTPTAINFEGYASGDSLSKYTAEKGDDGAEADTHFVYGVNDESKVVAYVDDGARAQPEKRTAAFTNETSNLNYNYLELSTGDGTLWRSIGAAIPNGDEMNLGEAQPVGEGIYLDTLVQFTAWEDSAPTVGEADKLAIWLSVTNVTNEGVEKPVTNLMVTAAVYNDNGGSTSTNFVLNTDVEADKWYRLTIKAFTDITDGEEIPGFKIFLDGTIVASDTRTCTDEYLEKLKDDSHYEDLYAGKYFASLNSVATLQAVGFQGTGAVDDIVWTNEDLFPDVAPSTVELTLTGGENATVAYVIGQGEPQTWDSTSTITVKEDDSITFTATPAEGFTYDGATLGDWTLSGTEITYTLANITEATTVAVPSAVAETPAYKVAIAGSDVVIKPSAAMIAALDLGENPSVTDVNAALAKGIGNTGIPTWQALFLGLDATAEGLEEFKVGSIEIVDGKVQLKMAEGVTLATNCGLDIVLKVFGSDEPSVSTDETETNQPLATVTNATEFELTPNLGETKKFYKVKVEFTATPAAGE